MTSNPTFAFVTIGTGSYLGSTVHDLTLANSLHKRGFKVVIYWMLEHNPNLVAEGIKQRILCHGNRYHLRRPSEFLDRIVGSLLFFLLPAGLRVDLAQNMPGAIEGLCAKPHSLPLCTIGSRSVARQAIAEICRVRRRHASHDGLWLHRAAGPRG